MTIEYIIQSIKRELIRSFAILDAWFDKDGTLRSYRSPVSGKTVTELIEHVMLINHVILSQIDKGCEEALNRKDQRQLQQILDAYVFDDASLKKINLEEFINHLEGSTDGNRIPCDETRTALRDQLHRSLCVLELLAKGEGVLYQSLVSVNNLERLDVYQQMYVLVQHVKRHIEQLEVIEKEFRREMSDSINN